MNPQVEIADRSPFNSPNDVTMHTAEMRGWFRPFGALLLWAEQGGTIPDFFTRKLQAIARAGFPPRHPMSRCLLIIKKPNRGSNGEGTEDQQAGQ